MEEGIKGFIDNLSVKYFQLDLNTPKAISKKYTGFDGIAWTSKVETYVEKIKNEK